MSEIEGLVSNALVIFALALTVRLLVRNHRDISYASILVSVGILVSALGVSFEIDLTPDIILIVLLPIIIFEGSIELNIRYLRENAPIILLLTVIGLPLSVVVLGIIGSEVFGFPLIIASLFAAIILPTDPAAVLSLFHEFDISERLSVTVEGESLLNDGVAIVIFSTLLSAYQNYPENALAQIFTLRGFFEFASNVLIVGGGGFVVGGLIGYLAHYVVLKIDAKDRMAITLLTVIVAYGSFILSEHFLGLSGVLATVGAGLLMGAHEHTHEMISESESFVQNTWSTASFLVSTFLYVLIGAEVGITNFVEYGEYVVLAAVLVVVIRALTVYPLVTVANRVPQLRNSVPSHCQHIMVWGGMHTVVPVALALSLPTGTPHRERIQTMVFGVAIISIVVQGLLMPVVIRATDVVE